MKKAMAAVLFAMVLCVAMAVPAWASEPSTEATEGAVLTEQTSADGAWQINTKAKSYVTKEQKKLFKQAASELLGMDYKPLFVMAQQVVAGMNYAYFCKATAVNPDATTSWKVVIVYQPVSGDATVAAVNNFNYENIKTAKNVAKATAGTGAWENNTETNTSKVLPKAARKAFTKAAKKQVGVDLTALVLVSSQTVAGMNYRYVCSGVVPGSDDVNYYAVDVYQNLNGKAKITSCAPIKMKKYLKIS